MDPNIPRSGLLGALIPVCPDNMLPMKIFLAEQVMTEARSVRAQSHPTGPPTSGAGQKIFDGHSGQIHLDVEETASAICRPVGQDIAFGPDGETIKHFPRGAVLARQHDLQM
jgi:hypothetical protein